MSRLTVKKATAGTEFELQTRNGTTTDRWFDVIRGGIHDLAEARVVNTTIPGAVGLAPDGAPVDDSLLIRVKGEIAGVGVTAAARRASFRSQMNSLRAQTPNAGALIVIKAYPPNEGLATGETATVTAQLQRFIWGPVMGWERQEMTFEALCVSAPVAWTIT